MKRLVWCWLACAAVLLPLGAEEGGISFTADGSVRLQNSLVTVVAGNRPGAKYGLTSWVFQPTGHEMIDALYGQTDYVKGHVLGERWDPVELGRYAKGRPDTGGLLAPIAKGMAADGSGTILVQESRGKYRLRKTFVVRRDLAVLELRYGLENLTADPVGFSLRFHSAMSPGARGKYQKHDDMIYMPTAAGVLELDQTLPNDKYHAQYKGTKFFLPVWKDEPKRAWVWGKQATPTLNDNWAAQVNVGTGDGMVFVIERDNFVGFYNCPGITLEPVMKAVALKRGEVWRTRTFLGSFTGAKGRKIAGATPLYVEVEAIAAKDGRLAGAVIPLFAGKLLVAGADGKVVAEYAADPDRAIAIQSKVPADGWRLTALDTHGKTIGSVDASGRAELAEPDVEFEKAAKPKVWGKVFAPKDMTARVKDFLQSGDFTVHCSWDASAEERRAAEEIAAKTGAGLAWAYPSGKLLVVGTPANNDIVRDAGLLKDSIAADWPGPGKGAILAYANFEGTQAPLLIVAGSDHEGVQRAIASFAKTFLADRTAPRGFAFWPAGTDMKAYPYARPPATPDAAILLAMAKGETEAAQFAVTAYEKLPDIKVEMTPLVDAKGKEIAGKYATRRQQRRGPLRLRWVNYYPTKPEAWQKGWTGYPDPLLERLEYDLEAGQTQALWLTVATPETAAAGVYTSTIACTAGGTTKTIPLKVEVWDFALPREGLKGEPYMKLDFMAPNERRELKSIHIRRLVENFADHGIRVFHVGNLETMRWHFSPTGEYKGKGMDWLEVSDDGKVALDCGQLDWLIAEVDRWAKPYQTEYLVYIQAVVNRYGDFTKAFPKRFAAKPKRAGHRYSNYYTEEMLTLFKRHLDRAGLADRVVLKVGDEPRGFDWWWDNLAGAARNTGIRYMTCFNSIDWQQAEKGLTGGPAIWQPLYLNHNAEFFKRAKAAGQQVSWYNCGPPPTINIGSSAAELRGYLWQAAKYDLDIIAWWGIQCWSYHATDLWTNRYSHHNSVVYPEHPTKKARNVPGKGWTDTAPLDGIRWELIREGMEDSRYVTLLRQRIAAARKQGKTAPADKAQSVLDAIWRDVFPTLNDYEPDYAQYARCRRLLAEAVLALR